MNYHEKSLRNLLQKINKMINMESVLCTVIHNTVVIYLTMCDLERAVRKSLERIIFYLDQLSVGFEPTISAV